MTDPSEAWKYKPPLAGKLVRSVQGASNLAGRSRHVNQGSPESIARAKRICGSFGSAEPLYSRRRPCRHRCLELIDVELPGVVEDGMSGRNGQRKPGTARGSPRRSRTAKALRISRRAVKSQCACEGDGWGRLSDDRPGHYNPDSSEGPWGGGEPTYYNGGASSSPRPDTERDYRSDHEVHEGRM